PLRGSLSHFLWIILQQLGFRFKKHCGGFVLQSQQPGTVGFSHQGVPALHLRILRLECVFAAAA
ncbi:MAG TPA: hypothetical protein H9840_09295, partial [Candidatus Anaerofilum excrementigallinarum]|nr:hypothetical protein [Candidatus Anaerofilum excrementigallinarum]